MCEIEREAFAIIKDAIADFQEIGDFDSEYNRIPAQYQERLDALIARAQAAQPASGVPEGWQQRLIEDYRREYIGQGVESWLAALPDRLLITQNGGPSDEL